MNDNNTEVTGTDEANTDATEGAETAPVDNVVTIEVANPTKDEMSVIKAKISDTYNFAVDVKETKFNFKKSKDKDTGIETIRQPVELALPYPNMQGLLDILEAGATPEGAKQLELLQDCIADVINSAARDILYENLDMTAATFPVDKVSWDAISKIPKAQRSGGGIPKETWEEFAKDYLAVMPDATGKTVEQVANAAKILQNKLAQVKTNLPVLKLLVEQLALYAEHSTNIDEYKECVEFLLKKADSLINVTPEELLSAL